MDTVENTQVKSRKSNPWLSYCKKIKDENPNLAYKEILVKAKETYKPLSKSSKQESPPSPPQIVEIKESPSRTKEKRKGRGKAKKSDE